MNKLLKSTLAGLTAFAALSGGAIVGHDTVYAQGSATVGSLRGVIREKATKAVAVGATVVATSPALVGEQVVLTDDNGQYFVTSLAPGVYTLTVYYENKTFARGNVLVQVGKEAVINITVDPTAGTGEKGPGEIIEIQGSTPIVDQGSTKTGVTLTDDFTRNVPTGRTFAGVLESSAGSQGDTYGTSFSGATSAENTYIVEGINTTDTAFGGISSNLPTEFIQETEVITGGYNAEFGRATGGIVNVVTKQGSNEFKGSVFGYYRPGALVSDAKAIATDGSSINTERNLDYQWDVGAELGGPIIKDKLWFHVGFNPSSSKSTVTRSTYSQRDDDDNGIPDTDANGLTIRDRIANTDRDFDSTAQTYFFTAKINGAINPNHQFQISAFGNPETDDSVLSNLIRNPAYHNIDHTQGAYDLSGKWTSKFNEGKTQIDAVVGFHRGYDKVTPPAGLDVALVRDNFTRSLFDYANIEVGGPDALGTCNDDAPDDPYMKIKNCPVLGYRDQGYGFVEDRKNDRLSANLALTQRVKFAGYHTFKGGLEIEDATYNTKRGDTGGADALRVNPKNDYRISQYVTLVRSVADGVDPMLQGDEILCSGGFGVCKPVDKYSANTMNLTAAAYLQDSWQILPNFTINGGARLENQAGYVAKELRGLVSPTGETIPDKAYSLTQIAPRVGAIWDPTQEGKAKIFGHWGRFYENVPMDINVRAFGGEIQNRQRTNRQGYTAMSPQYDPNCVVGPNSSPDIVTTLLQCNNLKGTASGGLDQLGDVVSYVSPNLKAQYTQELILGTEYEFVNNLKFGASYIHRSLPTVIEDVSADGGAHYLITNPGSDLTSQATDLRNRATALMGSGDPNDARLGALYADRANQLDGVKTFDKPVRNYDALQLTATQRPSRNSLLLASYTYSVSKGNYPGLFSTETGQLDPNLTSLYDLPELMANRYGNLGLDRPHLFKVDGFYAFDLKKAGILTLGGSFRIQSGIPRNTLAGNLSYGADESYLLPRGDIGRSPVTESVDLHIAYGYMVSKTTRLEGFVNIFNTFDQQDQLGADDTYTLDTMNPIVGGDANDLNHAKHVSDDTNNDVNNSAARNKNYGNISARTSPRNVQFGVRLTF